MRPAAATGKQWAYTLEYVKAWARLVAGRPGGRGV